MAKQSNVYIVTRMDGSTFSVCASNTDEVRRSCQIMGLAVKQIQRAPTCTRSPRGKISVRTYNAVKGQKERGAFAPPKKNCAKCQLTFRLAAHEWRGHYFNYNTGPAFCQEKSCTKINFYFFPISSFYLLHLGVAYGIIHNVKRERNPITVDKGSVKSKAHFQKKKLKFPLDKPHKVCYNKGTQRERK